MRNRQSIEMKQLVGKTGRLLVFFFVFFFGYNGLLFAFGMQEHCEGKG